MVQLISPTVQKWRLLVIVSFLILKLSLFKITVDNVIVCYQRTVIGTCPPAVPCILLDPISQVLEASLMLVRMALSGVIKLSQREKRAREPPSAWRRLVHS